MQKVLEIGNIVHLNSGSPDLKIIGIEGENVTVEWEEEPGKIVQSVFPVVSLR